MKEHGIASAKFTDGREWVHPDHLGEIDVGVKAGREADLMHFLKTQTDERSRRLVALGEAVPFRREPFRAELMAWVRERLTHPVPQFMPDSIHWQRKGS